MSAASSAASSGKSTPNMKTSSTAATTPVDSLSPNFGALHAPFNPVAWAGEDPDLDQAAMSGLTSLSDASFDEDPGPEPSYAEQSHAERPQVQQGYNAEWAAQLSDRLYAASQSIEPSETEAAAATAFTDDSES